MKIVNHIIVMVLALIFTLSVGAAFSYQGLDYSINEDDTTTVSVVSHWVGYPEDLSGGHLTYFYNYDHLINHDVMIPQYVSYNGSRYKVTQIGSEAFGGVRFKSLSIPKSVEYIARDAFKNYGSSEFGYQGNCNIKTIYVPSLDWWINLNFIGAPPSSYELYAGGEYVEDLVVPDGVESIRDYCFAGCKNEITSVDIPNSLKTIGTSAFAGCGIEKVVIHSLESWLDLVLQSTVSSYYDLYLGDELIEDLVIPDGVESIHYLCFAGCKSLKSVDLPNSLKAIGSRAFSSCANLRTITIPNSVESISDNCFYKCDSLKSVILPDGIKTIGKESFANCKNLKSVSFPESLNYVSYQSFAYCDSLKRIDIPSIESWCRITFGAKENTSPYFGDYPPFYGHGGYLYIDGNKVDSLVIPNTVDSIYSYAFSFNMASEIHLGDSIKWIGPKAFYGCYNTKLIEIPNSVKEIGNAAFYDCTCANFVSHISDPKSIKMGENVFKRNSNSPTRILWVPKGTKAKYKAAPEWKILVIREIAQSDVNGDYTADVRDITAIIGAILNGVDATIVSSTGYNLYDVNHDGEVDVRDVTYAIGEALGKW